LVEGGNSLKKLMCSIVFLIFLLYLSIATNEILAQSVDIAILCDVSRSIKNHELVKGKDAIQTLLRNGSIADGWELSSHDAINEFPFLAQHSSPISPGKNFLLLEFGTIQKDEFPYFQKPNSITIQSLQQVIDFVETNFPLSVTDQWTYEFLAEAVISKIMKEEFRSKEWYLFVLSDFIESHGFSMTDEQTTLVDNYLEGKDIKFSTPVILRWKQRPDLQIKIVKLSTNGVPQPRERITLLTPQNGYKFKNVKTINFIWNWKGAADELNSYTLVVRKKERDKYNLVMQQRLKLNRYFFKKPTSGNYEWFVTANSGEGTFRSPIRKFEVAGPSALPWFLFLLILFVTAVVLMKFILPKVMQKRGRKRDEL